MPSHRYFYVCIAALSATTLVAQGRDIVAEAATAIIERDAESLSAMRFTAYDLDRQPVSVQALLERTSECRALDERERGVEGRSHLIRFECGERLDSKGECESDILIMALDRATSPDVFAQMRFERLDTDECALPRLPAPG